MQERALRKKAKLEGRDFDAEKRGVVVKIRGDDGAAAAAQGADQQEPATAATVSFASKEEAEAAFKQMLVDIAVGPYDDWQRSARARSHSRTASCFAVLSWCCLLARIVTVLPKMAADKRYMAVKSMLCVLSRSFRTSLCSRWQ